jgi:hypothetical protein
MYMATIYIFLKVSAGHVQLCHFMPYCSLFKVSRQSQRDEKDDNEIKLIRKIKLKGNELWIQGNRSADQDHKLQY